MSLMDARHFIWSIICVLIVSSSASAVDADDGEIPERYNIQIEVPNGQYVCHLDVYNMYDLFFISQYY
jgi:hypothetical protein